MLIDWQNLRPWNGSQYVAFEELCCQLAACEQHPQGSTFIRKAPPDAGVECFWKLPTTDEWGWQAKYFLSPPGTTQWRQIDSSVKTALEKHPQLTKYTICLPIDRQDARIDQQKWFMDKWKEHLEEWKGWAQKEGMSVEFIYWGKHEIWERLSRNEHRGRYYFWFNKELFTEQWFGNRIEEAVANVGPRYSPELNVELPIARSFDGLGCTSEFYARIKILYRKIKRAYTKAVSRKARKVAKEKFDSLQESISPLLSVIEGIEETEVSHIDWDSVAEFASKSIEIGWECIQSLEIAAKKENKKVSSPKEQQTYSHREDFWYELHHLYDLIRGLNSIQDLSESSEARLSNVPVLLLAGNAGTGKTHLFCDVAKQRIRSDLPTLLLLGGQFTNEEPWSQIIRLVGLSCTKEEFLGAIEAVAEARAAKALILVDALNEGEGNKLWYRHLAGILTTLSRYPWISIAFSVRTSYENIVIPEALLPRKLVREVHLGFSGYEYEATRTFFDHYGIERPSIPLLVPEFQNPMFLKLFCLGLKNRGLTKVPQGLQGITSVFKFFNESINEKLSKLEYLDFDPKSQIVQKVADKLAEMMADKRSKWLPRDEAQAAVNEFLPREGYEKSLFRHLISEGVLAEDRFRIDDDKWCEGIHFSYERFADHLIAKYLLDKNLNPTNPLHSFLPSQPLGSFIKDKMTCWVNSGIIEAFSIQLPERIKKELTEVAPRCVDYRPVQEAFVESLIWRYPKAFTKATLNYINKHIIKHKDIYHQFLDALLTVASNPDHPYNADFLHKHLMKFELADREKWWSIFLHYQWGEHGAIDRLVDWAWCVEDKSHIDDKSIRLCGIALAWFLTTSNRYLRDRATKSLVSLLTKRIHALRSIIREFRDVNDPYVLERLFAVAYGCAMRSKDNEAIGELAKEVYEWIFKNGEPPPHILLRDYARGVVELALHRGIGLEIDVEKIRPPYKSEWPSFEIPTEEELKKYGESQEDMPDEEWARVHLYDSVMGLGDFARYIIGTISKLFEWSSPHLNSPNSCKDEHRSDLSIAQRWILKKVFDLGWSVERFGRFDRSLTRYLNYGREANKAERLGKKYQWIAYHEFLARASDNFEFKADSGPNGSEKYEGPWQIGYIRDIDPSCLLKKTERERWKPHTNTWWFPSAYDAWDSEPDDVTWLKSYGDLPPIEPLIELRNPKDDSRWFRLEGYCRWDQPTPSEEERFEIPSRDIWYIINSYIVKESDMDKLFEWAKKQNFMGRWMPESHEVTCVFLGEFFWAPAFRYHDIPYYYHDGWVRGWDKKIPKEVLVSTDQYLREYSSYDSSIDETISIYLPAKWIVDHMRLRWNGVEGCFFDDKDNLIAFDPSVRTLGPGALLINRDAFLRFLNDNGYDILWTIIGEKNILDVQMSPDDWKGRLELSGAYRIYKNKLEGAINTKFISRP